jgi:FMN reductase
MSSSAPLAIAINGSPSPTSRTGRLLDYLLVRLADLGLRTDAVSPRDLPAEALVGADTGNLAIAGAIARVADASIIIIGTPIYKAAYSGLLKTFLDLLPQDGLKGKLVLPLATAGSAAHTLALDYSLRPVIAALGAQQVLAGICASEKQVTWLGDAGLELDSALDARLDASIGEIAQRYPAPIGMPIAGLATRPALRVVQGARTVSAGC